MQARGVDDPPYALRHLEALGVLPLSRGTGPPYAWQLSNAEIKRWLKAAGLTAGAVEDLPGDPLTVKIWTATA